MSKTLLFSGGVICGIIFPLNQKLIPSFIPKVVNHHVQNFFMFHSSNACGNSANITTIQMKHGMGSEVTFNPYYKYLQIVFHQYFEIVYVSNEISLQKV